MANNVFQVKRTTTAARTPNTTGSYATNTQYIAAGELALNMTDKILYTSDGTNLITVGANSPSYSTGSGYGTATGGAVVNATTVAIGNSSVNVSINSTAFSGTANNATNLGGVAAASYVNTAGNYTLAGNINFTGTNVYHTSTLYVGGQIVIGVSGDIVLANGSGIQANGVWGTAGQALLTDGGGNDYWGLPSVLTANNSSYLGTVAASNYQGTANLAAAVALLPANNASYLGGTAAASYQLNSTLSANVATLSSNNSSYLGGVAAASYVNTSGTYTISGAYTYSANISLTGGTITTAPVNSTDIVNKQYADAIASGINFHSAVRLVTNADLGTATYNNGTSGVGATLTKTTSFAALTVDSVTAAYQDRILLRAQTNTALNGIYSVSNTGNATAAWVLTRAYDYDTVGVATNEIDKGDFIYVLEGTTGAGTAWVENSTVTTIGTDPITFVQFSSKGLYALTGGTGLSYAVGAAYDGSAATTLAVNSAYIATISANNSSYLGGTIASSYLANTSYGLSQNTSGIFVVAGTGAVVNATGVHVNATYIGTLSANNASYLGTVAAASYQLNSTLAANVATMAANSSTYANSSVTNTFTVGTASYFVSNGNMGIGTSVPSYSLVVSKNQNAATVFQLVNNNTGVSAASILQSQIGVSSYVNYSAFAAYNQIVGSGITTQYIDFDTQIFRTTGGSERMRIDSSGNVGIACTTPSYKLDVTGDIRASANIYGTLATTSQPNITANNASYLGGTIASSFVANTSFGLSQNTSGIFVVAGTGTVVNSTGVHVNSTYIGTLSANNASYLGTVAAASYQGTANLAAAVALLPANNASYLGGTAAASYALLAGPTFTGTVTTANTLTIGTVAYHVANGNLGLGTSSPAATLDVVGTVNTSKANTLSQTLTDGVTVSWDTSLGQVATVTLAGNRTMAAPTNLKVQTYILHVLQDATGSRTLTWNAIFKWPAGVAPTLTTTANARDIFSFVSDGTNLYGSLLPNVK